MNDAHDGSHLFPAGEFMTEVFGDPGLFSRCWLRERTDKIRSRRALRLHFLRTKP